MLLAVLVDVELGLALVVELVPLGVVVPLLVVVPVGLRPEAGVVRRVDGVVGLVLGVVELADAGLFAGFVAGLVLGRPVLPPPIVPPPVAGSCCATAMDAQANRHTKTEREIRGSRHRVDMRIFSCEIRQRCCCELDS